MSRGVSSNSARRALIAASMYAVRPAKPGDHADRSQVLIAADLRPLSEHPIDVINVRRRGTYCIFTFR